MKLTGNPMKFYFAGYVYDSHSDSWEKSYLMSGSSKWVLSDSLDDEIVLEDIVSENHSIIYNQADYSSYE